jgi:glycosyltransferase involved in cell wall biosynthesis
MQNKFTIIIPTRERCDTLYHSIRTCLNQTYKNYEIIISDNCSQDKTKEVVASFNEKKITYINIGKRVSMSENFEFALSHVKDGFLMFLGDDDGILPNSLEYVNDAINATNCKAIVSYNAFYTWPNSNGVSNQLTWSNKNGYEVRNSKEWIKKYLTFKMQYTFELPGAYCGFVHKDILEKVTKNGIFFRSSTPDAYSALAIAFGTSNYVYSYTAFAVHGSSANSNGGSFLSKAKGKEGQESKLFMKENTIPFHNDIIFTKAFRISSLEAYLQFSDCFPSLTQEYKIDWKLFLKYVLLESKENTRNEIEDAVRGMCKIHNIKFEEINSLKISRFTGLTYLEIAKKIIEKIKNIFNNKKYQIENTTSFGVTNIYDAVLLLKFCEERDR